MPRSRFTCHLHSALDCALEQFIAVMRRSGYELAVVQRMPVTNMHYVTFHGAGA